jgi:hypothetical protein
MFPPQLVVVMSLRLFHATEAGVAEGSPVIAFKEN